MPLEAPPLSPPGLWVPTLVGVILLCLLMVVAMVRFSAEAILEAPRRRPRRLLWLGALYLLTWVGIVLGFVRLFDLIRQPLRPVVLGWLLAGAAGWLLFNAGWIALVRGLSRPRRRKRD